MKKLAVAFITATLALTCLLPLARSVGAVGPNLIANPSVELNTSNAPSNWATNKTGTNTTAFNYLASGHTGSHSLQVQMTKRTSGQASWSNTQVAVSPSTKYTFIDWYQSNVASSVAVVINHTNGNTNTLSTTTEAASTNWKQATVVFTTPSNAQSVTVQHFLNRVGQLTTDDFDLEGPAPVAPTVTLTKPANNAIIKGTQVITATANGAAGVQFAVDNVKLGVEVTVAPYTVNWNTTTAANGTHTITATARSTNGLTSAATSTVAVANPTAPTVSISAPTAGATVSGTAQAVSATATDAAGITSVQFKLDGVNLGAADKTAPYSVNWNTTTATKGSHVLSAVATNTSNLTATATNVTVNVNNPTPPTVSIASPAASATVSGTTQQITANAADAQGITSVQFQLDGTNLGSPVTTAPYTATWDTTKSANGNHILSAVATNLSNLSTTSTTVSVNVQNVVVTPPPVTPPAAGPNLIANPSFETANGTVPASWLSSNWGTNTSTFSYLTTGHTGTRSAKVQITSYTDGAANWYYADIPVTAGKAYKYSNWYQSNVDTEVDAEIVMSDGTVQYAWLGTVFANTNWAQFTTTFTPPAGAKSIAIYQILAKTGYIISDDYSLSEYTPVPFNRGLVSITYDDGWANQYANAMPLMQQNDLKGTYYIISGELTDQPDYMTAAQVKALYTAGNEIGSHSVTHPDLTTLTTAQVTQEMAQSQTTLQTLLGVPVTDFAYPFGAYNANTLAIGKQYYQSQRTVNGGVNTKDNFDITQLKIHEVDSDISQAQVKGWIDEANTQHEWLILVYHEIATTPSDPTDSLYTTQPIDLSAELAYLKASGVAVVTVNQAINEILPQL